MPCGTALSEGFSAVPGPESGYGGTARHDIAVTPCVIVPCRVVLVPCSASAARLENYSVPQTSPNGSPSRIWDSLMGPSSENGKGQRSLSPRVSNRSNAPANFGCGHWSQGVFLGAVFEELIMVLFGLFLCQRVV